MTTDHDDYPLLNVSGTSLERLKIAMSLAGYKTAVGYIIDKNRLIYFWTPHPRMEKFPPIMPPKLNMEQAAEFAYTWLKHNAEYPEEPDHDGDNERGWRVYAESWGKIDDFDYPAFIAIEPRWAMIGK